MSCSQKYSFSNILKNIFPSKIFFTFLKSYSLNNELNIFAVSSSFKLIITINVFCSQNKKLHNITKTFYCFLNATCVFELKFRCFVRCAVFIGKKMCIYSLLLYQKQVNSFIFFAKNHKNVLQYF